MNAKYYQDKRKSEQRQRDIEKYAPIKREYTPNDKEYWEEDYNQEVHVGMFKRDEDYMSEQQKREWSNDMPVYYAVGFGICSVVAVIIILLIITPFIT